MQKRADLAQKFGLLLMLFIQQNRELPSLIEDHRPKQLSLFAHQAMDGSLYWLRAKTEMIKPPKVLEAEEEMKEGLLLWKSPCMTFPIGPLTVLNISRCCLNISLLACDIFKKSVRVITIDVFAVFSSHHRLFKEAYSGLHTWV